MLLNRLQDAVDRTLRDEQAGYRRGRSCTEQFTLRNIIEQSLEHQQDLIINFIYFKKAFDSVHRPSLWKILKYYGIPDRFRRWKMQDRKMEDQKMEDRKLQDQVLARKMQE